MKLGTETGSLTNHLYGRAVIGQPEPVVGMGATLLYWTDRHAATIVQVSLDKKTVFLQEDTATRIDKNGTSESQDYSFEPNKNAPWKGFRMFKNGWREVTKNDKTGRWIKCGGAGLRIGDRAHYNDYSF